MSRLPSNHFLQSGCGVFLLAAILSLNSNIYAEEPHVITQESNAAAQAGPLQTFHLNDGSNITGRLMGVDGEHYLVESPAMGRISILSSNVASIVNAGAADPQAHGFSQTGAGVSPNGTIDEQKLGKIQEKLMADEGFVNNIKELTQDETFMKILDDPQLMEAIMKRDMQAIENNPKTKELMNDPKMQKLIQDAKQTLDDPNTASEPGPGL